MAAAGRVRAVIHLQRLGFRLLTSRRGMTFAESPDTHVRRSAEDLTSVGTDRRKRQTVQRDMTRPDRCKTGRLFRCAQWSGRYISEVMRLGEVAVVGHGALAPTRAEDGAVNTGPETRITQVKWPLMLS